MGGKQMKQDSIFGDLYFQVTWKGKYEYVLFQQACVVELSVEGNEDEEIAETQRQAFINFNESKGILTNQIENMIYDYYQSQCQEYRNMFEEQADIYAPIIHNKSEMAQLVKLQSIYLPLEEDRVVILLLDTKWDEEEGIGIKIVNEKVDFLGTQCEIL